MFNLQGSEIIVILLIALVVLGPEKLPDAVRRASRTYHELKKMGNSFQSELKAAIDEPMREMRETADLVRDAADPRKLVERESQRAEAPRQVEAADDDAPAAAPVAAGDGEAVMGEMWEDDPALDPGSITVGTPRPPAVTETAAEAATGDDVGAGDAEDHAPDEPVTDTTDRPAL